MKSVNLCFETKRGLIVEPEWLARQIKRVKTGDRGAARVLVEDDFPYRSRVVSFDLSKRGVVSVSLEQAAFASSADWVKTGEGRLILETGEFAVIDEERAIDALAVWRDRREILQNLETSFVAGPGRYAVTLWGHRREAALAICLKPLKGKQAASAEEDDWEASFHSQPVKLDIGDELDLHGFSPKDAAGVIEEYCREAAAKGFKEVRIIHGKGIGELRRLTHAVLSRHPDVLQFADADITRGGPGATIVRLRTRVM